MGLERLLSSAQAYPVGQENEVKSVYISDEYVIKSDRQEKNNNENHDTVKNDRQSGEQTDVNCFQIVEISGKGTGIVALKKLYPGDLIMIEKPLIVVHEDIYDDLEKVKKYLDKIVNRLSCLDRELFLNLTDCQRPDDPTYLGIFDTNDMDFGGDAAVFPQMARANHSCQPNAEFVTDKVRKIQKLVGIDNIDKGEEITINYLPMEDEGTDMKMKRQKFLKKHYGFKCTCKCCSQENRKLLQNDTLRESIKEMQAAGLENLSLEELESLVMNLLRISSKHAYLLKVLDVLYRQTCAVGDQVTRLYTAVQGLSLASGLYGWTDEQTDRWREMSEAAVLGFEGLGQFLT